MRKIYLLAISVIMTAVCSTASMAQTEKSNKQRLSREQLADVQARHIAHELAFDDATTQKYVETFCAYQKEVWALGPRVKGKKADMTDAEAEKNIKARFEQSQKILNLREKYYKEYSKFLTQKQIQRAYELEKKTIKKLGRHEVAHKGKNHPKQRK